jgi:ABC-type Fe3+/spermidine/putrescine transport system ATPase subunit
LEPGEGRLTLAAEAVSDVGLRRSFGAGRVALEEVTLGVLRGEFFSLLGPSGCGKTTLLRIVAGFESPDSGEVRIDGRSMAGVPARQRPTNMVFQQIALFPHLNVFDNVAFGLRLRGMAAADVRRRVGEMLELVRLPGEDLRRPDELSGGQRQRVALARALVNHPSVLLLDEPLSALDLRLRIQMQAELRRLHRETGATFVFVTHDQGEAFAMSDRIAVMEGGRVVQVGTPAELYERPASRFVARFIGHANLLEGRVIGQAGEICLFESGGVRLAARSTPRTAGGTVAAALRFERIGFAREPLPEVNACRGRVIDAAYLGAVVRTTVRSAGGLELTADLPGAQAVGVALDREIALGWTDEDFVILEH